MTQQKLNIVVKGIYMKKNKLAFREYIKSIRNNPEIQELKKERKLIDKKDKKNKKDQKRLKDIDVEIGRLIREARGDKKMAEIKRVIIERQ